MTTETDEVYTGNNCNYPWQYIPKSFIKQLDNSNAQENTQ